MKKYNIVLASKSARRQELLKLLDIPFGIRIEDIDETILNYSNLADAIMDLAKKKAEAVGCGNHEIIIGADTIVTLDQEIFGKPKNELEARIMLKKLSGQTHHVITGVCLRSKLKTFTFYNSTAVTMYELTDNEINDYVSKGESLDKAGAYGIQGYGSLLIKSISGDYYSVMGLPVAQLKRALADFIERIGKI